MSIWVVPVRLEGEMTKITVTNHLTLDGVMELPEDWAAARQDDVMGAKLGEGMQRHGALLLGRRTYEQFFAYWPKQKDNPITDLLNRRQKYVVSRTLEEPLPWENSTLVREDELVGIKERAGVDLAVLGSGDLLQTLMRENLVDEYLLMIHPIVLGSGQRLFLDGGPPLNLTLAESITTTTGVVLATYVKESR
jgi:dihydrofolate reductase